MPLTITTSPQGSLRALSPRRGEASSGTRIFGMCRWLVQKLQVSEGLPSSPVEKAGQRHAPPTLLRKPLRCREHLPLP